MPLPRKLIRRDASRGFIRVGILRSLILLSLFTFVSDFFCTSRIAWALGENQPLHFSGDKQLWDRKANRVELFGHAAVNQLGETLTADYILLNLNSRVLDARGNCVYLASGSVIYGDEMHFNLDTRTGTVIAGRVSNDRFTLRGDRINKVGEGRFQTHDGNYTTCRDCSASWSLLAKDVDMEMEGYGYLSGVTTEVKDAPAFWLPYLVLPMKSKRQTGFLFPPFTLSGANGATFVLPFFWAINRSSDMTLGVGDYTQRGLRVEWEGRYALAPRSGAKANFYYLQDRSFQLPNVSGSVSRWALDISQTQELPFGIEEKLRLMEVSDNLYPFYFIPDLPQAQSEAFLPSTLLLSRSSTDLSGYVSMRRFRNLLNSAPGDVVSQQTQLDPRTVQAYPTVELTTNDRPLFGSRIMGGLTVGFSNFARSAGPFDYDQDSVGVPFGTPYLTNQPYNPGVDPIRQAVRLSVTPTIYTAFRPFDTVSLVPSLQYHQYAYDFGNSIPNLYRGYLLFQADLSTQIERIYDFPDDPKVPRAKHLIRPILTYSYIPYIREEAGHPFSAQIKHAQDKGYPGYNFDDNDIVPYTYTQNSANYFTPLGNSLFYGFTTQWIRRKSPVGNESPVYQTSAEFSAGEGFNFLEATQPLDPSTPHVFTRFVSNFQLNFERVQSSTTYYYYPDTFPVSARHQVSTGATLIFDRATHQRILTFDRSLTLGYVYNQINSSTSNLVGSMNFSLNDYLMPTGSISYGFSPGQLFGAALGMILQSPSQCWKLSTGLNYSPGPGVSWTMDLTLNLTGGGFGSVTDITTQAQNFTGT